MILVPMESTNVLGFGGPCGGDSSFTWPWPGLLWQIFALLFWVGLIAVLVWTVRSTAAANRRPPVTQEMTMDVLRRRLAEGEITLQEFERIQELLRD